MARTTLTLSSDEHAAGLSRPGGASARGAGVSGSQGTNSVRGTWSSEGEAGRHLLWQVADAGGLRALQLCCNVPRIADRARAGLRAEAEDAGCRRRLATLSYGNVRHRGTV